MNVILLSGGSGKRLWPLSNETRSKQFLKIFRKQDGTKESMVQRMYRMIKEVDPQSTITIATSASQIPQIKAQLGEKVGISVEPARRDTFPAIALATAYLKTQGVSLDESVIVCPVDPYVETDYFECMKEMSNASGKTKLTLMGIEPTYPSEIFGYIIPENKEHVSPAVEFKEKPDQETAVQYIKQGALWNGGVFAFRLSYLLSIAENLLGTSEYSELFDQYEKLPKISFDYAVVEKEPSINVIRFSGAWKDLGTWNTLSEAMDEGTTGNAIADGCSNTHIINELDIPLIALGVQNCIIAATPDGILISEKSKSPELKKYVADSRPMYERRGWGEYKVLNYKTHTNKDNSLVKELIITAGQHISYQIHHHRTEIWTFTEGTGELILDGEKRLVSRGDIAVINPGTKHSIKALTELHIIEVQVGDELTEEDIERLEWNWDKEQ